MLAGPTAVGKGTVSRHIRENYPERPAQRLGDDAPAARRARSTASTTTSCPTTQFDDLIARGEFLEYATVHNAYRYGTPRPPIDAALAQGKSVLLEIDLQGARAGPGGDAGGAAGVPAARRPGRSWCAGWSAAAPRIPSSRPAAWRTARIELRAQDEFDVKVVNHDVGQAAQEVVELLAVPGD